MKRQYGFVALLLVAVLGTGTALGAEKQLVIQHTSQADFEALMRDVRVEPPTKGAGLTLVKRDLIADETGEAYYGKSFYNNASMERISAGTWVRKEFLLDGTDTFGAKLCLSGDPVGKEDPSFIITVNGHEVRYKTTLQNPGIKYMYDSRRWLCGWLDMPIPDKYLKKGLNALVIRAEENTEWEVGIEISRFPDRSAKSMDRGASWQRDTLGARNSINGEYVIRLALDRYPSRGVITSPPLDLAMRAGDGTLGVSVTLARLRVDCAGEFPRGTGVEKEVRVGRTATYTPTTWTAWQPLRRFKAAEAEAFLGKRPGFRYLQYRLTLSARKHRVAPTIREVKVTAAVRTDAPRSKRIQVVNLENPTIVRASRRFVHMRACERQKILAKRLAPVIKDGKTQFEKVRLLMAYARKSTPKPKNTLRMSPARDALTQVELAKLGVSHIECEGRAEVMTQYCEAMGFNSRPFGVGHIMTEVWLNEPGKWAVFDPSDGRLYYLHPETGHPMSAFEMQEARHAGRKTTMIKWADGREIVRKTSGVWWAFDRFLISLRSNFNETDRPLHFMDTYSSRAHLVVLDDKLKPLLFTDLQSKRRGDFEWTLNQARLHLVRRGDGKLAVQVESVSPNFKEFVVTVDGKQLKESVDAVSHLDEVTGEFELTAPAGEYEIKVYPVNQMDVRGITTTLKFKVGTARGQGGT